MNIVSFNAMGFEKVSDELKSCCGSERWVSQLMTFFPFKSEAHLVESATNIWYNQCSDADWKESFSHHPKIGDKNSLSEKFAGKEQAGINVAVSSVLEDLLIANEAYEKKFGFIFIVCATGKSGNEMLRLLQDRLENTTNDELHIAMGEQHKITMIRLQKILHQGDWHWMKRSQLTTHVLDTSLGMPGKGVTIKLTSAEGKIIAQGVTDADGRVGDLLPPSRLLAAGIYKIVFQTGKYYQQTGTKTFYPEVEIAFNVFDTHHYHVPLLINPFGFSTYRGS